MEQIAASDPYRSLSVTPTAISRAPPRAGAWMTVEQAASILNVPIVTLRRSLERNACKQPGGSTISQIDGITARKLGRLWRVWLDAEWMREAPKK